MRKTNLQVIFGVALVTVGSTGCVARARGYAYAEPPPPPPPAAVVYEEEPPLVEIEPNVYVVYDYNVPIYYVGGVYWRFEAGVWYRSDYWNRGWVAVHAGAVPHPIAYRQHRHYVRYRPPNPVVYRAPTFQVRTRTRVTVPTVDARARARVRTRAPDYNEPVYRERVRGREKPHPHR